MKDKLNFAPFYVGQKVVYITGKNMPKDSVHVVSDIWKKGCGCWVMTVHGYKNEDCYGTNQAIFWRCTVCNGQYPKTTNSLRGGFTVKSFRPYEKQYFPLITLSKIQEVEKEEILIPN